MLKLIKILFTISIIVLVFRGLGYAACPGWVQITGTQYSMVAVGDVYIDGTKVDSPGYKLAVFGPGGDSDCRAVIAISDTGLGYLTIIGDVNGETISFKVCDSRTDKVYHITETVTFTDGDIAKINFNATATAQ